MVDFLVTSLRNPHQKADARAAYKELRMHSNESFFDFKLKFLQNATRGKIAKSEWKDDLYDKLTTALQDEMRIEVQKIQDFTEFADLTSGTDSRLKRDRARNPIPPTSKAAPTQVRTMQVRTTGATTPPTTQVARSSETPAPPRQYSAALSRPKQIIERRQTSTPPATSITCYNCGEAGHTRPECPHPRRDADLNEIVEQEDSESEEEVQHMEDHELSGNGSA